MPKLPYEWEGQRKVTGEAHPPARGEAGDLYEGEQVHLEPRDVLGVELVRREVGRVCEEQHRPIDELVSGVRQDPGEADEREDAVDDALWAELEDHGDGQGEKAHQVDKERRDAVLMDPNDGTRRGVKVGQRLDELRRVRQRSCDEWAPEPEDVNRARQRRAITNFEISTWQARTQKSLRRTGVSGAAWGMSNARGMVKVKPKSKYRYIYYTAGR